MKEKVLYVDDEACLLQGLKRMLRPLRHAWDMTFVSSAQQALQEMERLCFDVIVTDMRMPGMDGADLLNEVKKICPHSVRIILSGQADINTIIKALRNTHQYLAKPCEADLLINVVSRSVRLRDLVKNVQMRMNISNLDTIPSEAIKYDQVIVELGSKEPSLQKLGNLVASDVGMTVKVLQLVNSAFFGSKTKVFCPKQAVSILGVDLLRQVVSLAQVFEREGARSLGVISLAELNRHSISVSNFARQIIKLRGGDENMAATYATAAMLHDIGRIILALHDPDGYSAALINSKKGEHGEFCDVESELFKTNHAAAGAYLLGLWGLPDDVVNAAGQHQVRPPQGEELSTVASIVHIADMMDCKARAGQGIELKTVHDIQEFKAMLE